MSNNFQCLNCLSIGDCKETSFEKAQNAYKCVDWRAAPEAIINARNKALQDFGDQGLRSILSTKPKGK